MGFFLGGLICFWPCFELTLNHGQDTLPWMPAAHSYV